MLPTLRDVLALPAFESAAVEVLAGTVDTVAVRWVHSSEVYEMGGLLAGGELLLTTGRGLHGRSSEQLTAYIDQVSDAGCVALAMEVGRSFLAAPIELVEASRRRGLTFLTLHAVVPFERMIEDFHDLMLRRRLGSPRATEPVWQELMDIVVTGQGMAVLLNTTARLACCGAELLGGDGRVVETDTAAGGSEKERTVADVRGPTGTLGRLVLGGRATARRTAIAHCAAVAIALELGRQPDLGPLPSLAQSLMADLAGGVASSPGELSQRLSAAGWTPALGRHLLVAVVDVDQRTPARELANTIREAALAVLGRCLIGVVANQVILLAQGWPTPSPTRVRAAFDEIDGLLREGHGGSAIRTIGVATPVLELSDLSTAVAAAHDVVHIARRFGARSGVILARDVGIQRLLATGMVPAAVTAFIAEQLGPVIAFDTEHCADLVRTLDAYIANRGSKARTASALGIRRQSLYARLVRLEGMLGASLDDPTHSACLGLALTAWRMHTGLDPQAAFARTSRSRG